MNPNNTPCNCGDISPEVKVTFEPVFIPAPAVRWWGKHPKRTDGEWIPITFPRYFGTLFMPLVFEGWTVAEVEYGF